MLPTDVDSNLEPFRLDDSIAGYGGGPLGLMLHRRPVKNGRPIGRITKVVTATGWTLGGIPDAPIPPATK